MRNQNKKQEGFTLIELLVVIAIIALLSSISLIAYMSARQKARDAKRLSDMTQMNTALELYYSSNKGYPSGTAGIPSPGTITPTFASTLPTDPQPPDNGCDLIDYNSINGNIPSGNNGGQYYYIPSGTTYTGANGFQVYPDYSYYFCIGAQTGIFGPGVHILTPKALK